MKEAIEFLKSQKLMTIASGSDRDVWLSNLYYGVDDNCKIYFVSSEKSKHSQQILKNPKIAFSVVWFNSNDHKDRKSVQAKGICRIAQSFEEIEKGVEFHNEKFPEFKENITVEWIQNNDSKSHIWVIELEYIKHWDDELYGEKAKEFYL